MEREVKAEAAGDDVKEEGEERKLGGQNYLKLSLLMMQTNS